VLFGQVKSKNSLVTSFIGTFLSGKGKEYSPGTKSVYNTLKKHLEGYGQISRKDVTFESIGRDFYDGWTAYLIGLDMHPGTVGKYVKHLKALMHDAFDRGLHENVEYTKKYFAVTRQEPDMIYLTVEELGKMEKLKDLDDNQSFYRDIFVLSCRTGLRFSDWNKYRIEYVVDGNLTVKTKKTGQVVVIPLRETDVEVIRKWENKRLISNQNFNEMIKKVGRKAGIESMVQVNTNKGGVWKTTMIPKYELVCTHTARRSFATNAYLSGVPTDLIRRVTGHKTEKAFLRYIRIDGFKAAEELRKYDFFK
jgi:integrase